MAESPWRKGLPAHRSKADAADEKPELRRQQREIIVGTTHRDRVTQKREAALRKGFMR